MSPSNPKNVNGRRNFFNFYFFMKKVIFVLVGFMLFNLIVKAQGWQQYTDAMLADKCSGGFLLGKDGGIWAQSGFSLTSADQIAIRDINENSARNSGLTIKYLCFSCRLRT